MASLPCSSVCTAGPGCCAPSTSSSTATPWTFVDLVGRLGFPFPPAFAVASALSESAAVTLIAIGLFTRPAAAIVAFNMAVAFYNEAGKGDPFELPALYLLLALVVAVAGPGAIAMDRRRAPARLRR